MRFRSLGFLVMSLLCVVMSAQAALQLSGLEFMPSAAPKTGDVPGLALPGPVSPDEYMLGPGDQLMLLAYNASRSTERLHVNSEGNVLLPGLGLAPATGMSLSQFQQEWSGPLASLFSADSCALWIEQPRVIRVHLSGFNTNPEVLELPYLSRLDAVLAGSLYGYDELGVIHYNVYTSYRNVEIHRSTDTLLVDFLSFANGGQMAGNPLLSGGDHIVISKRGSVLRVDGPLRQPGGVVEFRKGDTPHQVLNVMGGVMEGYQNLLCQVVRRDPSGLIRQRWEFPITDPKMDSLRLEAWDQVYVVADRSGDFLYEVSINGEVLRPGIYAIDQDRTTLDEILRLAIPDTLSADLENLQISRQVEEDPELEFIETLEGLGDLTWFERSYAKSRSVHGGGTIALEISRNDVDFASILLRNGDEIFVPHSTSYVELLGAVRMPGFQVFQQGWTVRDYLKQAGGKLPGVPKTSIKIRRAGSVHFVSVKLVDSLRPGDVIMIPYTDELTTWEKFKEGLGVTVQLLSVVLLARSF